MDDVYLPVAFGTWAWHLRAQYRYRTAEFWSGQHGLRSGVWIDLLYLSLLDTKRRCHICGVEIPEIAITARIQTLKNPWQYWPIHPTCCIPSAHAHARLLVDDHHLGRVRPDVILPP